jgi:hypothetical protein
VKPDRLDGMIYDEQYIPALSGGKDVFCLGQVGEKELNPLQGLLWAESKK